MSSGAHLDPGLPDPLASRGHRSYLWYQIVQRFGRHQEVSSGLAIVRIYDYIGLE